MRETAGIAIGSGGLLAWDSTAKLVWAAVPAFVLLLLVLRRDRRNSITARCNPVVGLPDTLRLKLAATRPDMKNFIMDSTENSEFWNIEDHLCFPGCAAGAYRGLRALLDDPANDASRDYRIRVTVP